jgi:hypothetical protein
MNYTKPDLAVLGHAEQLVQADKKQSSETGLAAEQIVPDAEFWND